MTNTTNLVKKAFSVAVAATTILWSVGLSAFLPTAASAATFGDLIKGTSLSTVYYYGSNGQRYAFPNEKTYFSWYKDFASVKTISDSELASITLAGNIVYRPGARWIKITSDKKVYVTTPAGKIRWVETEATAKGLAGDNWNAHIDDVPDVFFVDYTVGDSLTSAASGYDGLLWSDATGTFRVSGTTYQKVTDAGFAANRFNAGFVLKGTGFTKSGLTAGAEISAAMSNLTDSAQKVTTATYAETQNVSIALSASSPAASTLLNSQGVAHLASLTFTNPTSSAVSVKSLKLARTGVSSDNTLPNVYLFNKFVRLSDAASVSSGIVSWNDALGLFTIPAGGTSEVYIRADIGDSTGQTVGVKLASASDVTFVGAFNAAGSFPISSAVHTIAASPSTFTSVSFGAATNTPAVATGVDAQSDFTIWQSVVTVNNNEAYLHTLRVRNIGSISASDIGNWRLYIAGVQAGSAVAKQDVNGYVTFDLSAAPIRVKTGTSTFKVVTDIIGGTTRTVTVGLRNSADAIFVDEDYSQADKVLAAGSAFSATDAGQQTIGSGALTVTKRTDSPSNKVIIGASNAVLARWDLKATGERMKVESLRLAYTPVEKAGGVVANDTTQLRNGAVYADGVQIGSTTTLNATDNTTLAYTEYSFGSSLIVVPGTPVTIELRSDIFDNDGTDNTADGDTFTPTMAASSSTNTLRVSTGSYDQYPANAVVGNLLEIDQGTLTGAKNTSYANQTMLESKVAAKIGSYSISSSTTETVNLTSLVADLDGSTNLADGEVTNLYLMYGKTGSMVATTVKANPSESDAGNSWSVNYALAPGQTMYVDVYGDLDSSLDGNEVVLTTLDFAATTASSGQGADNGTAISGQNITIGTGTFTSALDGSSPVAQVVAANQTVTAAKFRFSAANETYTIKELQVSYVDTVNAPGSGVAAGVELYDGNTLVGTAVFNQTSGDTGANTAANVLGLSIPVDANTYKVLTAKLVLNNVGFGAGTSNKNLGLALDLVKGYDSAGTLYTTAAGYSTDRDANNIWVFKSIPTVNAVDLTNSTVINGQATDLYKFTVTAASNGSIAMKQMKFTLNWSDGQTADSMELESIELYKNGVEVTAITAVNEDAEDVTDATGMLNKDANVVDNTLVIAFTGEDEIAAGETVTYTVRGVPQGFRATGSDTVADSVSLYLAGDTAINGSATTPLVFLNNVTSASLFKLHSATSASNNGTAYNFIWSDLSSQTHSSVSNDTTGAVGDWHNGFLVKNLDLAAETWTK
ncbi:hypothetical protein A3C09_04035 [Candidatus Uhrbacteria bacterium RIFCSPHIGHO2_02_FULL_47_44]|uniref:Uncharacterized protein n=1 Tax=Candidatus Uhrbacteria bacterium RIFCSPLOWO2_02_FULL_48_18 TaxID=1802408 RepID=A0A1F7V9A2_9BACT|nr:MAG: hypothetical protein A2839_01560 [Candidatus Uhrbacteria bacterium RIFCSPHIGHO2_01_FULL_47_10]OGL71078.1 MAG: hypothetical protein A3C09_04035 [Candidatus Uhrbacteria bacterium RIFCSPHIGHO2_02_FULL_47_44]OGL80813.1 MAG: hypothetical protein A3B20_05535 [Candidatus Uhrbacteria bacterium RIFCSPLOWO2_01_FULL_47_17]OGL86534.1 MAG: hypothetical protein A3I41_04570 [Candidatus Uhrbacteria bacterium RIFCSPLOWO2_02_FULL_48_18]OGL92824.1 MAG: hypothetical protein A3H12_02900 [Candidatus Uhrbacte